MTERWQEPRLTNEWFLWLSIGKTVTKLLKLTKAWEKRDKFISVLSVYLKCVLFLATVALSPLILKASFTFDELPHNVVLKDQPGKDNVFHCIFNWPNNKHNQVDYLPNLLTVFFKPQIDPLNHCFSPEITAQSDKLINWSLGKTRVEKENSTVLVETKSCRTWHFQFFECDSENYKALFWKQ